ncbi:hypothetical protein M3182_02315 [Mesobacillus maritimus]|uniref:hypothetical protein n=1 Tax=Mesobacillus maritimus TaxID=1643336 RepID=UPI00203D0548|nr:hypothetical protein [Mesobacillus maritimus]MCM3584576.1 hypothetical protein [Mesobacillus maritimus]MCM3670651.1 hypothetical protein [Mesobacillus maritimus]
MYSFRGDAHKLYLRIKQASAQEQSFNNMKELSEVEEIKQLYYKLDSATLKLIFYRMTKEKNGSGMIPIFVSSVPWMLFLFSNQIQEFLFRDGILLWIAFCVVYLLTLSLSVILHFRERAWAATHIEIIQDILKERKDQVISTDGPNETGNTKTNNVDRTSPIVKTKQ